MNKKILLSYPIENYTRDDCGKDEFFEEKSY